MPGGGREDAESFVAVASWAAGLGPSTDAARDMFLAALRGP